MKSIRLFVSCAAAFLLASSGWTAAALASQEDGIDESNPAEAGRQIAMKVDAVDTSQDSYSEGVMYIHRKGKVLTRYMKTYTKHFTNNGRDDEYNLFVFERPADVKGTKYLIWCYEGVEKEDDMWVYLPAENLVRRISGSSKTASFMRSSLSNEDVQEMDDVDEYTYTLLGSEVVDGLDCYIVERRAKPGKQTQYSKQVEWIRKDIWLRHKSDYYDKKGKLIKKLFFYDHQLIDGIWTAMKFRCDNAIDKDEFTVVEWPLVKYNPGLNESLFQHSELQR